MLATSPSTYQLTTYQLQTLSDIVTRCQLCFDAVPPLFVFARRRTIFSRQLLPTIGGDINRPAEKRTVEVAGCSE